MGITQEPTGPDFTPQALTAQTPEEMLGGCYFVDLVTCRGPEAIRFEAATDITGFCVATSADGKICNEYPLDFLNQFLSNAQASSARDAHDEIGRNAILVKLGDILRAGGQTAGAIGRAFDRLGREDADKRKK